MVHQTHSLARVEGIITALVFDHALRIRAIAETSDTEGPTVIDNVSSIAAGDTQSATSPDDTSNADDETADSDSAAEHSRSTTSGAVSAASTAATLISAQPVKATDTKNASADRNAQRQSTESKDSNLIGRINNLVTSDLENITEGRDVLFLGENLFPFRHYRDLQSAAVSAPLQMVFGITFLYTILGWRYGSCSRLSPNERSRFSLLVHWLASL